MELFGRQLRFKIRSGELRNVNERKQFFMSKSAIENLIADYEKEFERFEQLGEAAIKRKTLKLFEFYNGRAVQIRDCLNRLKKLLK